MIVAMKKATVIARRAAGQRVFDKKSVKLCPRWLG